MSDSEEGDFFSFSYEGNEPQVQTPRKQFSYNAKVCDPEWFLTADQPVDRNDTITYLKFRADLLFKKKQFRDAYTEYERIRVLLPPKNTFVMADIIESQVRCLVNMPDPPADPGKLALSLFESSKNDNQVINCLLLLQHVYHTLKMTQDEILMLQKCLSVHHQNADLWMKLANAYKRHFKLDDEYTETSVKLKSTSLSESSQKDSGSDDVRIAESAKESNDPSFGRSRQVYEVSVKDVTESIMDKDSRSLGDQDCDPTFSPQNTSADNDISDPSVSSAVEGIDALSCEDSGKIPGASQTNRRNNGDCDRGARSNSGREDNRSPSTQLTHSDGIVESCSLNTGMPGELVVLTCLLRARALLYSQRELVGLALERQARQQQHLQTDIERIKIPDDIFQTLKMAVYSIPSLFKEKVTEISLKDSCFQVFFENIWFSWPKDVKADVQLPSTQESFEV